MKLYNCTTREELLLKETDLDPETDEGLKDLANGICYSYMDGDFDDSVIALDAMLQIVEELYTRLEKRNTAFEYWEKQLKKGGVVD